MDNKNFELFVVAPFIGMILFHSIYLIVSIIEGIIASWGAYLLLDFVCGFCVVLASNIVIKHL